MEQYEGRWSAGGEWEEQNELAVSEMSWRSLCCGHPLEESSGDKYCKR